MSNDNALPLVIAVTGHRDLVPAQIPEIASRLRDFYQQLLREFPTRRLRLVSSLAEGSDQLAAEVALELGIELVVPLPMPIAAYLKDFGSEESVGRFKSLYSRASETFELESSASFPDRSSGPSWNDREQSYAHLGVFLAAHCHILLAIWDGKDSDRPGGTGHIVRFHHDDVLPGYVDKSVATQQMLVDDESDLIYHIVCSRNRANGDPAESLTPLDCCWFTKDEHCPRSKILPEQHQRIFRRSGEFSEDMIQLADHSDHRESPLLESGLNGDMPPGIDVIDRLLRVSDRLAIQYQKKTIATLRVIHVLAFLMGMMFILYSDLNTLPVFLAVFLIALVVASALQYFARTQGWHRKYLDYRALAEGLRVQFYWATAGVSNQNVSKFTHDSFLQAQDPEIGWIRNVMRYAGLRADAEPTQSDAVLDTTIENWIGSGNSGQLGYFREKVNTGLRHKRLTERLGVVSLFLSVLIVISFLFSSDRIPVEMHDPLMIVMGTMLLTFAIRHSYASAIAEKELIRQYEFMFRVFENSNRRLKKASDAAEKRQILLALGSAALDEQAEWILTQRERSIDNADILQMGS